MKKKSTSVNPEKLQAMKDRARQRMREKREARKAEADANASETPERFEEMSIGEIDEEIVDSIATEMSRNRAKQE